GTGGHHQQHAILTTRYGLNRAVDGIHLVVARHAPGAVVVVRRLDLLPSGTIQAFPLAIPLPELVRAGKLVEPELGFNLRAGAAAIMDQQAIAIAGEHERHVERLSIAEGLLHAGAERVLVVLRLDDGNRQVLLVIEDVDSSARLATAVHFAAHDNASLGEADFITYPLMPIPASVTNGRGNEFAADITLG